MGDEAGQRSQLCADLLHEPERVQRGERIAAEGGLSLGGVVLQPEHEQRDERAERPSADSATTVHRHAPLGSEQGSLGSEEPLDACGREVGRRERARQCRQRGGVDGRDGGEDCHGEPTAGDAGRRLPPRRL